MARRWWLTIAAVLAVGCSEPDPALFAAPTTSPTIAAATAPTTTMAAATTTAPERCPPIRVMPLGDSITEGFDIDTSYRRYLQDFLIADGIDFDFVGSHGRTIVTPPDGGPTWGIVSWQKDYAGGYDIDFEGHGGWQAGRTISEVGYGDFMLAQQIGFDLPAYNPHVVLLMIGINDLGGGWARHGPWTVAESIDNVVTLIERTRELLPDAVIVVAPPTRPGITSQLDRFAALSTPILDAIRSRARTDIKLVVAATLHDDLTASDIVADGIHPNATGARKLAAAWYEALEPWLGRCPSARR